MTVVPSDARPDAAFRDTSLDAPSLDVSVEFANIDGAPVDVSHVDRDTSAVDSTGRPDGNDAASDGMGKGGSGGTSAGSGGSSATGGSGGQSSACDPGTMGTGGTPDAGATAPTLPAVGQSCNQPGQMACAGVAQKLTLLCSSGKWKLLQTCGDGQNCDQSSGVCADILPACAGREPNSSFCVNDVRQTCGPDLVSGISATCCGACLAGQCQAGACGDGKVQGNEECDDGNSAAADGCEPDCKRSKVVQLAAGLAHTCALLRGGLVRCWGKNDQGQLGLATNVYLGAQKPYQNSLVQLGGPAIAIVAGGEHTCVLMQDGTVRCWGKNGHGQLGLGHTKSVGDDDVPGVQAATVQLGSLAAAITAGGDVTCALLDGGLVRCWGRNDQGQLGLGHMRDIGDDEVPSAAVATVALDDTVRAVGTGGDHTCVVLASNDTRCWGRNDFGQLGTGSIEQIGDDELPTAVPAIEWIAFPQFGTIQPSATRTFAGFSDGSGIRAWGDNDDGGLGLRFTGGNPTLSPTNWGDLSFYAPILSLAVGSYHACARLQSNELRCWGINDKGQLGLPNTATLGDNEPLVTVAAIDLGKDTAGKTAYATAVAAGAAHTCAVLNSGVVRCWGANGDGQLGLGFINSASGLDFVGGSPASVPAVLDPVRVFNSTQ